MADVVSVAAEFVVFISQYAFLGDVVRVGAGEAGGFVGAVDVDHEAVARGGFEQTDAPLDGFLGIAVDEVDLHAGRAEGGEVGEGFVNAGGLEVQRVSPDKEADVFRAGVIDEAGQVDVGGALVEVAGGVVGPGEEVLPVVGHVLIPIPVHELVGPTHLGGEIDVFAVGAVVAAGPEALVFGLGGVDAGPPGVPGADAGFDPGGVGDAGGGGEGGDEVVGDEVAGGAADHEHAPRADHGHAADDGAAFVLARRELGAHGGLAGAG